MSMLPFKRTTKRKSVGDSGYSGERKEDNPLDMFQLRKDNAWFAEQERKAAEKPARQDTARRNRLAEENTAVEAKLSREASEYEASTSKRKHVDRGRQSSKRRHASISSDDQRDVEYASPLSHKTSRIETKSPSRSRGSEAIRSTPRTQRSSRPTSSIPAATQIIALDDSDDENVYTRTPTKSKSKKKSTLLPDEEVSISAPARRGSDVAIMEPTNNLPAEDDDDVGAQYVRAAQERAKKRREEQEARDAGEVATAEILVESRLEGIPNLKIRVQINKKMSLVRDAWRNSSLRKLEAAHSTIGSSVVDHMFFTWRNGKVLDFYTLERMGIVPNGVGNLYPSTHTRKEGYMSWDKVHFEAWTPELFEQEQVEREKTRKRHLEGLVNESDMGLEPEPQPSEEKKIKVILRSKNYEDQKRSVGLHHRIGKIIAAFRKSAGVPAEKIVEIHLDGERLGEETEMEELGLEDLDVLEVHVKDP